MVLTRSQTRQQFIRDCPNDDVFSFWMQLHEYLELINNATEETRILIIKSMFEYLTLMIPRYDVLISSKHELITTAINKAIYLKKDPLCTPKLRNVLQEYIDRLALFNY